MFDFLFELTSSKAIAAFIACAVTVGNFIYYLYTMYKGQTKPHLYTWLVWGLTALIIAFIQTDSAETQGAWLAYTVAFVALARAALAIPYGEKEITKGDSISLFMCLGSIVFWLLLDSPLISVFILTFIDLVAYYPTFRKSWHKPMEEPAISHFIFGATNMLSVMSLDNFTLVTATYQSAVALFSYLFVVYVIVRRKHV
jgi:hypothetical protein